jgi:arylsulfatase
MGRGSTGQTIDNPVEIRYLLPTFLDTAGVPIPDDLDGKSLLHLVRTNGRDWRSYIDLEHNVCYNLTNHWNGLTDGNWKYIFHAYSGEEQMNCKIWQQYQNTARPFLYGVSDWSFI